MIIKSNNQVTNLITRLLQTLKESYSEWEMRGQCSDDLIEKVLKLLDKKQVRHHDNHRSYLQLRDLTMQIHLFTIFTNFLISLISYI